MKNTTVNSIIKGNFFKTSEGNVRLVTEVLDLVAYGKEGIQLGLDDSTTVVLASDALYHRPTDEEIFQRLAELGRQVVTLKKLKVNYKVVANQDATIHNRNQGRNPMTVEIGEIVDPGVVSIMSQPGFADMLEIIILD